MNGEQNHGEIIFKNSETFLYETAPWVTLEGLPCLSRIFCPELHWYGYLGIYGLKACLLLFAVLVEKEHTSFVNIDSHILPEFNGSLSSSMFEDSSVETCQPAKG
jgi:hypothetical protein